MKANLVSTSYKPAPASYNVVTRHQIEDIQQFVSGTGLTIGISADKVRLKIQRGKAAPMLAESRLNRAQNGSMLIGLSDRFFVTRRSDW